MTEIFDMASFIKKMQDEIVEGINSLSLNKRPKCAFVLVGDNEFSHRYVKLKRKACDKVGIDNFALCFPDRISEIELISELNKLNEDGDVNGVMVQMPLPKHINEAKIRDAIISKKDVDGLRTNSIYDTEFVSCIPAVILKILESKSIDTFDKTVLIYGKNDFSYQSLLSVFSRKSKNLLVADKDCQFLPEFLKFSDIVISICNNAGAIKSEWLKEGCVFFDGGNTSIPDTSRKSGYRVVGDLNFDSVNCKADFITPVPGGLGPAGIAMLTYNIYTSFINQNKKIFNK